MIAAKLVVGKFATIKAGPALAISTTSLSTFEQIAR